MKRYLALFIAATVLFTSFPMRDALADTAPADGAAIEEAGVEDKTVSDTVSDDETSLAVESSEDEKSADNSESTVSEDEAKEDAKDTVSTDEAGTDDGIKVETSEDKAVEVISENKAEASWDNPQVINVGEAVKGSLSTNNVKNVYEFSISEPGYVDFDFSHEYEDSNKVFWVLHLYDKEREGYLYREYRGDETEYHDYGSGLPAGTYYILIDQAYWNDLSTKEYTFKVNYTKSDYFEKEVNDSMGVANVISVNQEYSGNIRQCTPGLGKPEFADEDWYKFSLSKPGYVNLSFCNEIETSHQGDPFWSFTLYQGSPSNSTIVYSQDFKGDKGTREPIFVSGLPKGDYYIRIGANIGLYHGYGAYSQKIYRFNVMFTASDRYETELNGEWSSPNVKAVMLNTKYNGNTRNGDDIDYYKFTLSNAGNVRIDFSHGAEISNETWRLKVYKDSDFSNALIEEVISITGTTKSKSVGLGKGTYYLKIEPCYYWNRTLYNFKVVPVLNVSASKKTIQTGESVKLNVTGNQGGKLSFSSSNEAVAVVDQNGKVTGRSEGTAKITVTAAATENTGKITSTITIKVNGLGATSKLTAANISTGIKLNWKKVKGAKSYLVYCNNKKLAEVKKLTWTDSRKLKNGAKYTYKIVAKADKTISKASTSVVIYRLDQGKLTSVKNLKGKKIRVDWKKNAKATGYQVQYSTSAKFTNDARVTGKRTVKGVNNTKTTISGLKNGTYYVRSRPYKTAGGKTYFGAWSTSKKVKVSK